MKTKAIAAAVALFGIGALAAPRAEAALGIQVSTDTLGPITIADQSPLDLNPALGRHV